MPRVIFRRRAYIDLLDGAARGFFCQKCKSSFLRRVRHKHDLTCTPDGLEDGLAACRAPGRRLRHLAHEALASRWTPKEPNSSNQRVQTGCTRLLLWPQVFGDGQTLYRRVPKMMGGQRAGAEARASAVGRWRGRRLAEGWTVARCHARCISSEEVFFSS